MESVCVWPPRGTSPCLSCCQTFLWLTSLLIFALLSAAVIIWSSPQRASMDVLELHYVCPWMTNEFTQLRPTEVQVNMFVLLDALLCSPWAHMLSPHSTDLVPHIEKYIFAASHSPRITYTHPSTASLFSPASSLCPLLNDPLLSSPQWASLTSAQDKLGGVAHVRGQITCNLERC